MLSLAKVEAKMANFDGTSKYAVVMLKFCNLQGSNIQQMRWKTL